MRAIEETGFKAEVKTADKKNTKKEESGVPYVCCVPKKKN